MKICITAQGRELEALVDPRFGRCAYLLIVDTETMEFEIMDNTNAGLAGGAGIQTGQLVSRQGVKAVLTGNVGPNVFQALKAAGIAIVTGVSGKVADVISKYKKGEYKPIDAATVESHFGMQKNNG